MQTFADCLRFYNNLDVAPGLRALEKMPTYLVLGTGDRGRSRDVDKSKALAVEVFKLLRNSGYGKLIKVLECQTRMINTKDEKVVDRALHTTYFSDLEELRKPRIIIH